ncbi:MAG: 16S rRNA (cytidine(1402)-2'-O)-methyltransferase [Acidimicrobiales bacterium]
MSPDPVIPDPVAPGSVGGRLVLVPTPLGNLGDLVPRAAEFLAHADVVACEDTRHTARLLALIGVRARRLVAVHEHNEATMAVSIVERVRLGETVVLVSDAGMPGISDPGERVVRAVAEAGQTVSVVPGGSAGISALVVSGFPTGRWVFEGFLPRKGAERGVRLDALATEERTAVLFEAPHRLMDTLVDLARVCGNGRRVVIVRELTKLHEEVWRGTLEAALARKGEPRGEHVVVLDGAPAAPAADDAVIAAALADELALDGDRRAAVSAVTAALAVPRRRVYDVAVAMRDQATFSNVPVPDKPAE